MLMLLTLLVGSITIYVGPQSRNGFVDADKGVLESVADIQKELRKKPGIQVVSQESAGTVRLYVIGRGKAPSGGGSSISVPIGTSAMSVFVPSNALHIETLLKVGQYERPFTVLDHEHDSFGWCGKKLAKDVLTWIDANRGRIAELQAAK